MQSKKPRRQAIAECLSGESNQGSFGVKIWPSDQESLGSKQLAERSGHASVEVCQWDGSNQESLGSESNQGVSW